MIDMHRDRLLTLTDAANRIPGRGGKRIAYKTVWKWAKKGVKGIVLETIPIGGILMTSEEALTRFTADRSGKKTRSNAARPKTDEARVAAMRKTYEKQKAN